MSVTCGGGVCWIVLGGGGRLWGVEAAIGSAELCADVRGFDDAVFLADEFIDFSLASFTEHCFTIMEKRFWQFLFTTRTGLHTLHFRQGVFSFTLVF
jgi:hypothetical protein